MPLDKGGALVAPAEIADSGAPVVPVSPTPACAVCGAVDQHREPFAIGYDYELLTCSNRWTFVECGDCGHVWLDPRPSVDALEVIYPSTYYAPYYSSYPRYSYSSCYPRSYYYSSYSSCYPRSYYYSPGVSVGFSTGRYYGRGSVGVSVYRR